MGILKNFRRGFATNSSSSHSLVFMKNAGKSGADEPLPEAEFGWQDFRLDTLKEKLFYVLVSRIGGYWGDGPSDQELDEAISDNIDDFPEFDREDFREAMSGYVDHESRGIVSLDEARDPHSVIFGGNDNSGPSAKRGSAITNGEIDWTRTSIDPYDDEEYIREDDKEGQEALRKARER